MGGCRAIQEEFVSSHLPSRPSLNHLRKQAKALLARLRRQNPNATLVEAQHALAREYGFASWPKLKLHVEAAALPAQPVTFHRYTEKARQALFFSRYEASQFGSLQIEPEHVLLALIRSSHGLRGGLFERVPLSLDDARAEMVPGPAREQISFAVPIPFSDRTKVIFRVAVEEADAMKHESIGLAHILLGVLRDGESMAARLLMRRGMRASSVRAGMAGLLNEEPDLD